MFFSEMTTFLFGMIILMFAIILALSWALPLSLLISYVTGYIKAERGEKRRVPQLIAFFAAVIPATIAAIIIIFINMSGNAGSGVEVFGRDFDDMTLTWPGLFIPVIPIVGEVLIRSKFPQEEKAGE